MSSIRTVQQLLEAGFINPENVERLQKVQENFAISLPPDIIKVIEAASEGDRAAIMKQFVPDERELSILENELSDPISDKKYQVVKGVVHRYPDRCLLMPITSCPVACRFCFRREQVGTHQKALTEAELQNAYQYIKAHPEIWEVILTGGDPLILKPKTLYKIFRELEAIDSVDVIRIHTRVPVVDSDKITEELIQALKISKAVYIAIHCNHPAELTEKAVAACARLTDAGFSLLGQTVLLKGINDTPQVMGKLMRLLVKNRIKPYYLHHGDLARGTSHFRTSIKEGQQLMKALRGLCQPNYVMEIPGGYGKVPISASYIKHTETSDGSVSYELEDYQGNIHYYKELFSSSTFS